MPRARKVYIHHAFPEAHVITHTTKERVFAARNAKRRAKVWKANRTPAKPARKPSTFQVFGYIENATKIFAEIVRGLCVPVAKHRSQTKILNLLSSINSGEKPSKQGMRYASNAKRAERLPDMQNYTNARATVMLVSELSISMQTNSIIKDTITERNWSARTVQSWRKTSSTSSPKT